MHKFASYGLTVVGILAVALIYSNTSRAQSGGYYYSYVVNGAAQENGPYDNWSDCIDARNQAQQEAEGMKQTHESVAGIAQNANAMGFSMSTSSGEDIPTDFGNCSLYGTSESNSSSAGGANPYANNPMYMMTYTMTRMLVPLLAQGLKDLFSSGQQGASQEQAQEERQRELEAERIQAALARQKEFQNEMRAMVQNDMRGPAPPEGEMTFKGANPLDGQEMTFKDDSTDFFGENGGSGRTMHFRMPGSPQAAPTAAMQQLQAANCLSRMAAQPGLSPEDSKYLSDQAAEVMQGGTTTVDLSACAQTSETPPPPPAPHLVRPLTRDQITLYTNLLNQVDNEQKQAVSINQNIHKLEQARNNDAQQVAKQKQVIQQLQAAAPTSATIPSPMASPSSTSSDAMAEALAALQKAKQSEASDDAALTHAKNQMQQLNQHIQQSRNCLTGAQNNPASAGALLGSCGG